MAQENSKGDSRHHWAEVAVPQVDMILQSDTGERFPISGSVIEDAETVSIEGLPVVVRKRPLPIEGLPDNPLPVFSVTILGLPSPPEVQQGTVETDLAAEVRDQNGDLVDETYDPARWNWAIVLDEGGGASFGGVDNDDLTVSTAPGELIISAEHIETEALLELPISVVAAVVFSPALRGLPSEVEEGSSHQLSAEVLNSDGSVQASYDPADWTFSLGGTDPATLSGANLDILDVNPASAPDDITVTATYTGALNVSPATDQGVATVVPAGFIPIEPSGMTIILNNQGDTTNLGAGWSPELDWNDPSRLAVVADAQAEFGNALEKRAFVGDSSWLGALNRGNFVIAGGRRELYVRYRFRLSPNWQKNSIETPFLYGRKIPGQGVDQFNLSIRSASPGLQWKNLLQGTEVGDPAVIGTLEPDSPMFDPVSKDQYHVLELLHRLNTPGNADGYLRVALNEVEVSTWNVLGKESNVDLTSGIEWIGSNPGWDPIEFTGLVVFHQWGNTGTKNVNDFVRMGELYMSARN